MLGLPAAVLAVCRRRLRGRAGARAGWILALATAFAFALMGSGHDGDARAGLLAEALRWLCWLGLGPLVLVAAADPRARDDFDGMEQLALIHGVRSRTLALGRVIAAAIEGALRVSLPFLGLALLFGALEARGAFWLMLPLLALFALVVSAALGALAGLCGELAGARGRVLLLAIVLLPWLTVDARGSGYRSIPGAVSEAIGWFVSSEGIG